MLSYFSVSLPAFSGDKGKCRHGAESRVRSKPLLKARGQGPHHKEAPVQRAAFPWRESGASAQRAPYTRYEGGGVCVCVIVGGYNICSI